MGNSNYDPNSQWDGDGTQLRDVLSDVNTARGMATPMLNATPSTSVEVIPAQNTGTTPPTYMSSDIIPISTGTDLLPQYPNATGLINSTMINHFLTSGDFRGIFSSADAANAYINNIDNLEYHDDRRKNHSSYAITPEGSAITSMGGGG